jgi:hypothetical protein
MAGTTQRQRLCSRTFARQNKARLPAESRDPSFDPTIRRGTPDPCLACLLSMLIPRRGAELGDRRQDDQQNQHDCQPRRVGRELALRGSRHSPLRPLAAAIARDPPDLRGDISTPNSRRSRARMGVLRSGFASAGESGYVRRSWQLDLPAGSLRRLAPPSAPAGSWAAGPCETSDRNRSLRAARRPPWLPLWLIACPNGCGRLFTWMQSCRSLCVGSPTDRCRRADRRRVG